LPRCFGARPKLIAPESGVFHFEDPEKLRPRIFVARDMDKAGLQKMSTSKSAFRAAQIPFKPLLAAARCMLPMKSGESIYGFGLHTELFDLTKTGKGIRAPGISSNRRTSPKIWLAIARTGAVLRFLPRLRCLCRYARGSRPFTAETLLPCAA